MEIADRRNYWRVHTWLIKFHSKNGVCEMQGCQVETPSRTEFALKRGYTYEKKRENFLELCPSCHRKYDYTEELREKNRLSHTGKENPSRWKAVVCLSKIGEKSFFKSITMASNALGISITSINNCLNDRSGSAGGYKWEYASK